MIELLDGRSHLYQWDTGRKVLLKSGYDRVHIRNSISSPAIPVDVVVEDDNKYTAVIPDEFLQETKDIVVYAISVDKDGEFTSISKAFQVEAKPKPADYVYTPTEQITMKKLLDEIENLKKASSMILY